MDESSILRRRGLQVGDPSLLETQHCHWPAIEDFKVPFSFLSWAEICAQFLVSTWQRDTLSL